MALASVNIRFGVDMKEFSSKMQRATKKMKKFGKDMKKVGSQMTTGLTLPAGIAGAAILKTAADFQTSMNSVKAITGAVGKDFEALRAQARELGSTTQFSASQAADGMRFLAQAGFETREILSAMPSTLNLAAAAQLDLGSAANIVSNIMSGFGIQADKLGGAVDVLATQFTSSNTDLEQLGEAMKFVGPQASAMGFSFNETAAAVGLLSNAGLQAGLAGRGLRVVMAELSKKAKGLGVTVRDSGGQMLSLATILDNFKNKGITTQQVMDNFSKQSATALITLQKQGGAALRQQAQLLQNSQGKAKALADVRMEGLNGALKALRSAAEELAIAFADSGLLDLVTTLAKQVTKWVRRMSEAKPVVFKVITAVAGLAAVIGPLLTVMGVMATSVIPAMITGFTVMTGPVGLTIAAIAALGAAFVYIADNWKAIKERVTDISWWRNALIDMVQFLIEYSPISFFIKQINNLLKFLGQDPIPNPFEGAAEKLEGLKVETKEYKHEFGSFGDAVKNASNKALDALMPLEKQGGKTAKSFDKVNESVKKVKQSLQGLGGSGGGRRRAVQIDAPDTRGLASMGPALPQGQGKDPVDTEAVDANPDPYRPWRESLQKFQPIVGSVQQGFQGFFNTLLQGGQNPFQAIIDSIKQLITRLLAAAAAAAVLAAIMSAIGVGAAAGGGGFGAGFKQIFGGMTGLNLGKSAAGGANMNAAPRLVGEMGPEVFVPQGPGRIIPNNQLRGGGGVQKLHVTAGDMRLQGDTLQTGIKVSQNKTNRWR